MSIERELLQRCLDEFEYKGVACNELCIDINKLLAQPEQEQEPVAWMLIDKETGARIPKAYKPEHGVNKDRWELYPLHTTLPKPKPLTPQQISEGNQSMFNVTREAFKQGVIFAEKAHGIGVDDESI